jgi:hypothetical protein
VNGKCGCARRPIIHDHDSPIYIHDWNSGTLPRQVDRIFRH